MINFIQTAFRFFNNTRCFFVFFLLIFLTPETIKTCKRLVYKGSNYTIITARSMDWKDEIPANLWLFLEEWNATGKQEKTVCFENPNMVV